MPPPRKFPAVVIQKCSGVWKKQQLKFIKLSARLNFIIVFCCCCANFQSINSKHVFFSFQLTSNHAINHFWDEKTSKNRSLMQKVLDEISSSLLKHTLVIKKSWPHVSMKSLNIQCLQISLLPANICTIDDISRC